MSNAPSQLSHQLGQLLDRTSVLATAGNVTELADALLSTVREVVPVTAAAAIVVQSGRAVADAQWNTQLHVTEPEDLTGDHLIARALTTGQPQIGSVTALGAPIGVADIEAAADDALVVMPMVVADRVHGVLVAIRSASVEPFGEMDEAALRLCAHHGAIAAAQCAAAAPGSIAADEVLALVSHDIKGPLTSIYGFAETLRRRPDIAAAQRDELLSLIARQAQRINRLVSNLLDLQRIAAGGLELQMSVQPLAPLLADAVNEVSDARAGDVDISIECDDQLLAFVDSMRLHQMVGNLVWNACSHGSPPVSVVATADGDEIAIVVRDHGSGIADDMRGNLFRAFAPGASDTGLGLAIVDMLARAHGGSCTYADADGGGAAFTLGLPADERPSAAT